MVSEQAQIISYNLWNIKYPSDAQINLHGGSVPQRGKVLPTMGQHGVSGDILDITVGDVTGL